MSHDGSGARSVRQSKRYSMTTLYLSMSAQKEDLEIEDDLARGTLERVLLKHDFANTRPSAKNPERAQDENFVAVQEELCIGEGCPIFGFADSAAHSEPHGTGRGKLGMNTF